MPIFGFRLELGLESRQLGKRGIWIGLLAAPIASRLPHPRRPIFIAPIPAPIPIPAFAPRLVAAISPVGRIARLAPVLAIAAALFTIGWGGRRRRRGGLLLRGCLGLRWRVGRSRVARRPPPPRPSFLRPTRAPDLDEVRFGCGWRVGLLRAQCLCLGLRGPIGCIEHRLLGLRLDRNCRFRRTLFRRRDKLDILWLDRGTLLGLRLGSDRFNDSVGCSLNRLGLRRCTRLVSR
jgi:hypothetical protein